MTSVQSLGIFTIPSITAAVGTTLEKDGTHESFRSRAWSTLWKNHGQKTCGPIIQAVQKNKLPLMYPSLLTLRVEHCLLSIHT